VRPNRVALTFLALTFASVPVAARADDSSTFVSVGPLYYDTSSYFNRSGQREQSSCDFQKSGYSVYVDKPVSATDNVHLSTEYDDVRCGGPSTRGLTDIEVDFLKGVGGKQRPRQFQVEGGVIIPSGYSIAANPRLGLGRTAALAGGVYNGTFKVGALYGYVTGGAVARVYTGYPAPQLISTVTAGLNLTHQLLFYEQYYGTTHLGAGGTLTNIGLNPTVNAVFDSYTISENVAYTFASRTALDLTYQTQLGGWNSGIGTTFQAGLWHRF
jgi:hypothetical protein